MSKLDIMKSILGTDTEQMLIILASIYGEDKDQKALHSFITRTTYHEIPIEATQHFQKNYPKYFGLTVDNIVSGCFLEVKKSEGFYVVNNPELNSEYVFLYKKYSQSLIIHPFEVHDNTWKLITPMKVSVENDSINLETLSEYTTTPDGNGRTYFLPADDVSQLQECRNYNLAFFCFISIHCAN